MLNTFAHNGHDHIKEMAQVASNGYITSTLLVITGAIIAVVIFLVIKRKKK